MKAELLRETEAHGHSIDENGDTTPVSPAYRRYALFLLMLVALFSIMDRQIVNILAELIRRDLDLSDAQLGLMTGFAFAIFYSTLGLPLARLAETHNRSLIIAASLALWSAFTIACGYAQNFLHLFLARIMVGVGEAGSGPAGQSLVADLTPRDKRASALAFVAVGIPLGTLIGMAGGGLIAASHGWRTALIVAGAPGLLLALIVALTLRDPRRKANAGDRVSFKTAFADTVAKRSFWWFSAGSMLLNFTGLAFNGFAGSFFLRRHPDGLAEIARAFGSSDGVAVLGPLLGAALGLSAVGGVLAGGWLADFAMRRDARGYMTVSSIAAFAVGPLYLATVLAPTAWLSTLFLALAALLSAAVLAPILASAQSIVQPRHRATAAALIFLISNLFGLGLGPPLVGLMSDAFAANFGPVEGLNWALITACLACPLGAACFWRARRHIAGDIVG